MIGLAEPVEQLLEALEVRLILGRHLQLGRRDRHGEHDVVPAARDLGEVVQEGVELRRQAALAAAADVVHQLVDQDEARAGRSGSDPSMTSPPGAVSALLVLLDEGEALGAAQLEGDLAPRRLAGAACRRRRRDRVIGVELGADEDGRRCRRHALSRPLPGGCVRRPSTPFAASPPLWRGGRAASARASCRRRTASTG